MENGRSPVLGSDLSEAEGTELMEGAAAVGTKRSHIICYGVSADCHM